MRFCVLTKIALIICAFSSHAGSPYGERANEPTSDFQPFEISLGYNYLYLSNASPEAEHMHGGEISAFWNINSWLGIGGELLAGFGESTHGFFFNTGFLQYEFHHVNVESRRYVYLFGPRITVFHNDHFRVFVEGLAGQAHAEADISFGGDNQDISDNGLALMAGAAFDMKITRNISWRILEADYLPTNLGTDWQHEFRAATGIVFGFGK